MTLPHVKTNGRVLFEFCVEKPASMHEFCCHKGRKSFFQFFLGKLSRLFQTVVVFNRL